MRPLILSKSHYTRENQEVNRFFDPAYNPFARPLFLQERLIPLVSDKKVPNKGFKYKHLPQHTSEQLESWMQVLIKIPSL